MPTGGSHGGVESVLLKWANNFDRNKYDLRFFHISPGTEDYLKGYDHQWTVPLPDGMRFADYHFCLSGHIAKQIMSKAPDAKCFVIGNPLENSKGTESNVDCRQLCFVGRISAEKRLDVILNALALARDCTWKLMVIGTGDLEETMAQSCKNLGISDRVLFRGWRENPWDECKCAAIDIIASDYEGFSITALEASREGKTIITTPVSGCTDFIVPGENGYFFDFGDANGLAKILDFISEGDLKICSPKTCRDSIQRYLSNNYFKTVEDILNKIECEYKGKM